MEVAAPRLAIVSANDHIDIIIAVDVSQGRTALIRLSHLSRDDVRARREHPTAVIYVDEDAGVEDSYNVYVVVAAHIRNDLRRVMAEDAMAGVRATSGAWNVRARSANLSCAPVEIADQEAPRIRIIHNLTISIGVEHRKTAVGHLCEARRAVVNVHEELVGPWEASGCDDVDQKLLRSEAHKNSSSKSHLSGGREANRPLRLR